MLALLALILMSKWLIFWVPQGSVVGPPLLTFYKKPVADIIDHHHLSFHLYADDTQLYTSFDPSTPGSSELARKRLSFCISDNQTGCLKTNLNSMIKKLCSLS